MKIFVTGGTGFIGQHLVSQLVKEGHCLTCLVRKPTAELAKTEAGSIRHVVGDLTQKKSLVRIVEGHDLIFHLAGAVTGTSRADFDAHNFLGTKNLFEANIEHNPTFKNFVFISSLAAAGPKRLAQEDDTRDAPVSDYGKSKKAAEEFLKRHHDRFPVSIVRPPIVYGPGDKQFLPLFKMVRHGFSVLIGGRERFYSTIFVEDLVKGIMSIGAQYEKSAGNTYYLSEPAIYSWKEVVRAIELSMGESSNHIRIHPALMRGAAYACEYFKKVSGAKFLYGIDKYREAVAPHWVCSAEKAKAHLGFQTKVDLYEGMRKVYEDYRKRRWLV